MKKITLGNTQLKVTELCFGCLPFGPLQKNLSVEESAEVLSYGLDLGINFLDTAQMYKTYEPIRIALANRKDKPIIASKSTASTYEGMETAINEALAGMGVDHVDIFHLHAAKEGPDLFEKRKGAVECLKDYKKKGIVKFIGTSTHNIELVKSLAEKDFIDVVFPLINREGRGVIGGNAEDMQKAIAGCAQKGKGIYLMKVLGGGALIDNYEKSMDFGRSLDENYSIAVGMISKEEVLYNVKYFNGERDLQDIIKIRNKKQVRISPHMCMSCGVCINTCHNDAISVDSNGKSVIDPSKCLQCGYCLAACPHFAIRVI